MPWVNKKSVLLASTAVALSMVASSAFAGGFALREQSAYYQGMSFAGNGTTGESISSMFWNPATLIGAGKGLTIETHSSFIMPESDIDGTFAPGALTTVNGATSSTAAAATLHRMPGYRPPTQLTASMIKWCSALPSMRRSGLAPNRSRTGQASIIPGHPKCSRSTLIRPSPIRSTTCSLSVSGSRRSICKSG